MHWPYTVATDVLWQYQDGPEIQVEFFCQAFHEDI